MEEQSLPRQQETTPQEQQLTRKERKQLKREQKQAGKLSEQQRKRTKSIATKVLVGVILLVVLVSAYFLISQKQDTEPLGPDLSQAVPSEGAGHVDEGEEVIYQSNPPTSGLHWPSPLRDGIYDTEKPDQGAVHGLEHGRIWVSYKPSISEETKETLVDLLKGQALIILTPRSANDTDIAVAAWERLDTFDLNEDGSLDEKRILDFVKRYRDKGPEKVAGTHGSKTY